eukprot:c4032_g1_i2.p1 GENE.c4032_g1_i2~~c4032_g1_i2.p1  ORF type:complete len:330 (-),score=59.70 c4032_g1_i2:42-1031(-)
MIDDTNQSKCFRLNTIFQETSVSLFPKPAHCVVTVGASWNIVHACHELLRNNIMSAPVVVSVVEGHPQFLSMIDSLRVTTFVVSEAQKLQSVDISALPTLLDSMEIFARTFVSSIAPADPSPYMNPMTTDNNLLDVLLRMKRNGLRRIPIINARTGDIENVISQSEVIAQVTVLCNRGSLNLSVPLSQLALPSHAGTWVISENDLLIRAFACMTEQNVSALAVINSLGHIVGMIQSSDIHYLVVHQSLFLRCAKLGLTVQEFLVWKSSTGHGSSSAITCTDSATLDAVMAMIVQNKVHRVFVVNNDLRPSGVVSISDIFSALVDDAMIS